MTDPEQDEDRRLAERLIELAKIIQTERSPAVFRVIPVDYADDLLEAAAFINRFRKGD